MASQEAVWTLATSGIGVVLCDSHSASASTCDPAAAAGVPVPLIHPFQSRESRFESNSHNVLVRTVPPYPEMSIIRSAPKPSIR